MPEVSVESMFEDARPPPPEALEVSFDTPELDVDAYDRGFRSPARGERFNVLRPPVHEPFRPPPPTPDPLGGARRQVGQVGRFAVMTEADPPPRPDYLAEARARLDDRMQRASETILSRQQPVRNFAADRMAYTHRVSEEQIERRAAIHETLPTAYDRLMSDDPYEDDLE
jgi:hypothetical protein